MKQYILTAKLKVDSEDIRRARTWARDKGLDYKDDVAQMVLDCLSDRGSVVHEIVSVEIEEE